MALYAVMALAIATLLGVLYFQAAKARMLAEHRLAMQLEGERYLPELLQWMQGDSRDFPSDPAYATAFYLGDHPVQGNLEVAPGILTPGMHSEGKYIYLVIPMGFHDLAMGRTVMMTRDDGLWLRAFYRDLLLYGTGLLLLLAATGYGLSKLFLRPMRAAVRLLDDFIKDTTHELNTPVTAILTNVELLENVALEEKQRKKLDRIETAARTIGSIYDDMTFLLLRDERAEKETAVDMGAFVQQRLEYFHTRFEAKRISVQCRIEASFTVSMKQRSAMILIDNLLSNAVKYADTGGEVAVSVRPGTVSVANSGSTIPEAKREAIFERYVRADAVQGGFGIGLHLVARIARSYGIRIGVDSDAGRTAFTLNWSRYTPRSP